MADLRAMASGLESKSIGSGGGAEMPTWSSCVRCEKVWRLGSGLEGLRGGVIGETGGRTGEGDFLREEGGGFGVVDVDIVRGAGKRLSRGSAIV